jgi:hypothetical protein
MTRLTLEQVRQVGRPAYYEHDHRLGAPSFYFHPDQPPDRRFVRVDRQRDRSYVHACEGEPEQAEKSRLLPFMGWSHYQPCGCEFCQEL